MGLLENRTNSCGKRLVLLSAIFFTKVLHAATEITSDVLSHHIWGPRRKTWGIEMTIITSLLRGADRHSAFVDIASLNSRHHQTAKNADVIRREQSVYL